MNVDMLGANYGYALGPYSRPAQMLGATAADTTWIKDVITMAKDTALEVIRLRQANATTQAEQARLAQIYALRESDAPASAYGIGEAVKQNFPFIVAGGVILVAVIVMMGTRRRR